MKNTVDFNNIYKKSKLISKEEKLKNNYLNTNEILFYNGVLYCYNTKKDIRNNKIIKDTCYLID